MDKVTLQPGDYVATADIKDEAEYQAIVDQVVKAGFNDYGESGAKRMEIYGFLMIDHEGDFISQEEIGAKECVKGKRQLTPAQILATPQWVPEVGEECEYRHACHDDEWKKGKALSYHDDFVWVMEEDGEPCTYLAYSLEFRPLPTEEDRAVEEMMQASGVMVASLALRDIYRAIRDGKITGIALTDKQPHPAEEINFDDPANWRAGDVLECVNKHANITVGIRS